jgi:WG repeat protein
VEGKTVFKGTYEKIEPFADHRAAVRIKEKWGYINELGKMIIPAQFDWAASFSEGLAFVKLKLHGEGYFIDTHGKIIFSTAADVMTPFKNGLVQLRSCITKPCHAVYVDKQGRTVWQGPSE